MILFNDSDNFNKPFQDKTSIPDILVSCGYPRDTKYRLICHAGITKTYKSSNAGNFSLTFVVQDND